MDKKKITIELDLGVENIVYLTYEQLLEKYPNFKHIFYEEDLLIWLDDLKFIHCMSRHPREVEEGENYEFRDSDEDLPIEDWIRFYGEKSILSFLEFAEKRWKAINELIRQDLDKIKGKS